MPARRRLLLQPSRILSTPLEGEAAELDVHTMQDVTARRITRWESFDIPLQG